ncbi:MAG: hypothetical protein BGO09_15130 [Bacteroidetes bacterium 47-18]|nr:MAG: hypothetical protein BGO09_15130 [Bacteroidetes bacterium 47-18]
MIKQFIKISTAILLLSFGLTACKKEATTTREPAQQPGVTFINGEVELNPVALTYFQNIKTIVFATRSNELATYNGMEALENDALGSKLHSLDIVDFDTEAPISFFEMPTEEQHDFMDSLVIAEALNMSQRLAGQQDLTEIMMQQNEIIETVMAEFTGPNGFIANRPLFFETLTLRLYPGIIDGNPFDQTPYEVSDNITHSVLINSSRRGDFLVALPKHNQPWVLLNLSHERFKVGHAAILTANITSATAAHTPVTVEAWADGSGVTQLGWGSWRTRSYVMGIRHKKIKWTWRRGFHTEYTPVGNPGALADHGLTHLGKDYVHWTQFLTAKWAADNRFTCTTLVWWCSKRAYNINVSNWLSPLVTPSDLYLDNCTYVRGVIQ